MNQSTQNNMLSSTDKISDKWKRIFMLIEKAGGDSGTKYTTLNQLSFSETFRMFFNAWALLFGPIYYVTKGMWKKGVTLTALFFALNFAIGFILGYIDMDETEVGESIMKSVAYGMPALFCFMANMDYYKKMVLGKNGWW
jgi:hypothetical protein